MMAPPPAGSMTLAASRQPTKVLVVLMRKKLLPLLHRLAERGSHVVHTDVIDPDIHSAECLACEIRETDGVLLPSQVRLADERLRASCLLYKPQSLPLVLVLREDQNRSPDD